MMKAKRREENRCSDGRGGKHCLLSSWFMNCEQLIDLSIAEQNCGDLGGNVQPTTCKEHWQELCLGQNEWAQTIAKKTTWWTCEHSQGLRSSNNCKICSGHWGSLTVDSFWVWACMPDIWIECSKGNTSASKRSDQCLSAAFVACPAMMDSAASYSS